MEKKEFEQPTIEKVQFNLQDKTLCNVTNESKSGLFSDGTAVSSNDTFYL